MTHEKAMEIQREDAKFDRVEMAIWKASIIAKQVIDGVDEEALYTDLLTVVFKHCQAPAKNS